VCILEIIQRYIYILNRESNIGKAGVWIYLIGDRRRYEKFRIKSAGSDDDDDEEGFVPEQRKKSLQ
jgi:hypothetical protein